MNINKLPATWGTPPQIGDTYKHPHTGELCRIVRVRDEIAEAQEELRKKGEK